MMLTLPSLAAQVVCSGLFSRHEWMESLELGVNDCQKYYLNYS